MPQKLCPKEVRRIRRLYRDEHMTVSQISRFTKHTVDCVEDVVYRRRAHAAVTMPFPKA